MNNDMFVGTIQSHSWATSPAHVFISTIERGYQLDHVI